MKHFWCKFDDSISNLWWVIAWTSGISYNSELKRSKWSRRSGLMTFIFFNECPMMSYLADMVTFWDRQTDGKTDGWMDGQTKATRIPLWPFQRVIKCLSSSDLVEHLRWHCGIHWHLSQFGQAISRNVDTNWIPLLIPVNLPAYQHYRDGVRPHKWFWYLSYVLNRIMNNAKSITSIIELSFISVLTKKSLITQVYVMKEWYALYILLCSYLCIFIMPNTIMISPNHCLCCSVLMALFLNLTNFEL